MQSILIVIFFLHDEASQEQFLHNEVSQNKLCMEMFFKTAGQENFAKIYKKKHGVYESHFLIKLQVSPRNFCEISHNTFFVEHL